MYLSVEAAKNLVTTCAAAVTLGVALVPSNALAVTIWNWSFTTDVADQFGSGTFTTADVVPALGTTYQITGISGTYNRGGIAYSITSLNSSETNQFQLNSISSSSILTDQNYAIGFIAGGGNVSILNDNISGFSPVTVTYTSFISGSDGDITSSSIAPNSPPSTAVPGPLPLLGAAAAFQASRRLRRRLNGSLPAT